MHTCDICSYSTNYKTNIYHHKKTKKHILNFEKNKLAKEQEAKKIKNDENEILKQKLLISETEKSTLLKEKELIKIKDDENEILKQKLLVSENEILKQKLLVSETEKSALLKYIDLLLQNKNNSKIRNYKKKCRIPATIRNSLWQKYFKKSTKGKCCCCKIENISSANFDCGHIISEHNGGFVSLDNLKPICRLCNSSMSTMNMDEFIKNYGLDCITVNK